MPLEPTACLGPRHPLALITRDEHLTDLFFGSTRSPLPAHNPSPHRFWAGFSISFVLLAVAGDILNSTKKSPKE
jgi:hypothetical protein